MKPTTEENKAIALLEKKGYKVKPPAPPIRYGMIVRCKTDECDMVITVHDGESDDSYKWGGTAIGEQPGGADILWIHQADWDADNGEYTVIGEVNLSKFIKPVKQ